MKREDICTIVKDVAYQFGYEYRDHLGLIYLTKEDDEIEVCCCHELPQSIIYLVMYLTLIHHLHPMI